MFKLLQLIIFTAASIVLYIQAALTLRWFFSTDIAHFATQDFIEYWSAYALASSGQDPYSAVELLKVQQSLDASREVALMMWLPPWFLLVFAPILSLPYLLAAKAWFALNVFLFVLIIWTVKELLGVSFKSAMPAFLSALIFAPVWNCLQMGQVSLITTLGAALFALGMQRKRATLLAIALVLLSFKPHVCYLLLALGFFHSIRIFRLSQLISILLPLAFLCLLSELMFPGLSSQWVYAFIQLQPGRIPATQWISATLTGQLRILLGDEHGVPLWPSIVVPGICSTLLIYLHLSRRVSFDWQKDLKWLLVCSYLTAPMGWFFDQSIILISHIMFCVEARASLRGKILVLLLIAINTSILGLLSADFSPHLQHHQLFWLPLVYLFVILLARPISTHMKG